MSDAILRQYIYHAPHIQELIKPMHMKGIAGVFYVRVYSDGSIINLASDANWTEYYFKQLLKGGYQDKDINDQCFTYPGISLWELNPTNQIWRDGKQYFGYGNGVTLCDDYPEFREIIGFYSTTDNQAMNHFYINHIDTLKNMKHYFLSQAVALIQQAEHERRLHQHPIYPQLLDLKNRSHAINLMSPVRVFHKETGIPIYLSPQRSQCFIHLMQGKSTKDIAIAMHLSPKTIEHYIEFLRKELGCRSSKELIFSYAHQI